MTTTGIDEVLAASVDTRSHELLLAATNHDLEALKKILHGGDAKVQDVDSGFGPLHAAIAACEPDDEMQEDIGDVAAVPGDAVNGAALGEDSALETIQLLFEYGAIWNELDSNDETPGCMAFRFGLRRVYEAIVAAGIRAELLFDKLDQYQLLPDEAAIDQDEGVSAEGEVAAKVSNGETVDDAQVSGSSDASGRGLNDVVSATTTEPSPGAKHDVEPTLTNPNVYNEDYLKSDLTYSGDRLLDSDKNAVMMDWETEIMKTSADQLCRGQKGLRTMNVGHGMGIVDELFLANDPSDHHIVEAHPQVLERMRQKGWFDKPNVTIHQGKWQDVLPKLVKQGVTLDAIYYDTYAEDYKDLKEFFDEYVIALLDQHGLFGFYNGLGADRQVCYDVYTKVSPETLSNGGWNDPTDLMLVLCLTRWWKSISTRPA